MATLSISPSSIKPIPPLLHSEKKEAPEKAKQKTFSEIWNESSPMGKVGIATGVACITVPVTTYHIARKAIPATCKMIYTGSEKLANWSFEHIVIPTGQTLKKGAQAVEDIVTQRIPLLAQKVVYLKSNKVSSQYSSSYLLFN